MRRVIGLLILVASIAVLAVACGGSKTVSVEGTIVYVEETELFQKTNFFGINVDENSIPITLVILEDDEGKLHRTAAYYHDYGFREGQRVQITYDEGDTVGRGKGKDDEYKRMTSYHILDTN